MTAELSFDWTARGPDGRHRKGATRARNQAAVIAALRDQGLFPIDVRPAGSTSRAAPSAEKAPVSSRASRMLTLAENDMFVGRLAKLVGMGITLDRALGFIEEAPGAKGKTLHIAQAAAALRKTTREGTPLSEALKSADP